MAFTLTPDREEAAERLIKRYPVPRAACIPILHLCQQQLGWVSPEVIAFVANKLGMTTSQVQGVVTFYTSFHQEPVAPNVVWVCRTLSCDLRGGKIVQEHLEKKFGCHAGETSRDGKFTLKKAECLAACGQAPMVQINDEFYENLTLEKLDQIISEYAQKTPASDAAHAED
ncbi:MAG: NAD(P)H-dependent oxidoreductase subunit E [Myxococcales bacterium]